MPLKDTEDAFAAALESAATGTKGDAKAAWKEVARVWINHVTANALVTGSTPNGGPLVDGKIS